MTDPALCATFAMQGKAPVSLLAVTAERVYFQCPKALVRLHLWSPEAQIPRSGLPSAGEILDEITKGEIDSGAYDRTYPQRLKDTLY